MGKTYTTNYNLTKPDGAENILTAVGEWNNNFDAIDAQMKTNADAAAAAHGAAEAAQDTADAAIPKSLATGANQVPVSTGDGTWASKTFQQFKQWLALVASDITDFAAAVLALASSAATANKIMLRDANGRSKVAAPSANDDIARLMEIKKSGPWVLIQSYTTAGVYSFVAPDFYGDGQPYYIGVYMMGGGGSGGVYSTSNAAASGGAAGYGKNIILQVTPGQNIPVVIGAGGASVYGNRANGNSGGSTSFNGITVNGGEGGTSGVISAKGASGGQGSDAAAYGAQKNSSKYGCVPTVTSTAMPGGMSQSPQDGQNAFDPLMVTLAAGGGAYENDTQYGATLPDGTKGGDSAAGNDAVAESATGNGNGGGAATTTDPSGNVTSGAGAPGAIYIYARTAVI